MRQLGARGQVKWSEVKNDDDDDDDDDDDINRKTYSLTSF